ncbi:MAG: hypothetical protein LBC96_02730 [Lachnospiraceae bacterium]|jgi:hypothetical protein|nr:hypothetical protein [Lachnospiraceae bacterium]
MEKIVNYLVNECKQKEGVAVKLASQIIKHDDIRIELESWIEKREYPAENSLNCPLENSTNCPLENPPSFPVTIEGYTAAAISALAPFMDGVGVYNFMVTLRERPDNAKRIIAEGFVRK